MFIRFTCCFLFLVIIASCAIADVKISRTCDSYTNITEFDLDLKKLVGEWFDVNSYSTDLACTTGSLVIDDEETISLTVTGVKDKKLITKKLQIDQKDGNQIGISNYLFRVLGTDYTKYVVVWNCIDSEQAGLEESTQNLWILTNDKQLTIDQLPEVNNILNKTTILLDNVQLTKTAYDAETCSLPGGDGSASKSQFSIGILAVLLCYILF